MKLRISLIAALVATQLFGCGGSDDTGLSSGGSGSSTEIVEKTFPTNTKDIVFEWVPSANTQTPDAYDLKITNNSDKPLVSGSWRLYVPNLITLITDNQFVPVKSKQVGGYQPSASFQPIGVGQSATYKADVQVYAKGRVIQDLGGAYFSAVAPDGYEQLLGKATWRPTANMKPFASGFAAIFFPTIDDPLSMLDVLMYQSSDVVGKRVFGSRSMDNPVQDPNNPAAGIMLPIQSVKNSFIPYPKQATVSNDTLSLTDVMFNIIASDDLSNERQFLKEGIEKYWGIQGATNTINVELKVDPTAFTNTDKPGSYKLDVTGHITITGIDAAGVFYGNQSLFRLLQSAKPTQQLSKQSISDGPNLSRRTFILDTVRHFSPVAEIKQLIDEMASLKLNVLTLGLNNDNAWRLEIPSIPELTNIGAKTGFGYVNTQDPESNISRKASDDNQYFDPTPMLPGAMMDGPETKHDYYSQQEMIDLIKYANARHVYLNLEINSIGHATALLDTLDFTKFKLVDDMDTSPISGFFGIPRLATANPCMPDFYKFYQTVFTDVKSMYDSAGVKMQSIHLGGDEVFAQANTESPVCENLGLLQMKDMPAGSGDTFKSDFLREIQTDIQTYYYQNIIATAKDAFGEGVMVQFWNDLALHLKPEYIDSKNTEFWIWSGPNVDADKLGQTFGMDMDLLVESLGLDRAMFMDQFKASRETLSLNVKTALATNSAFYLDMPTVPHKNDFGLVTLHYSSDRRVYTFDPFKDSEYKLGSDFQSSAEKMDNIVAALWTETAVTKEMRQHLIFPRLIGFADQAWNFGEERATHTSVGGDRTFTHFNSVLREVELPKLATDGIDYRVELPGAVVNDGMVMASTLHGDSVYYTNDGSEPAVSISFNGQAPVITPSGSTKPCFDVGTISGMPFEFGFSMCNELTNISGVKFIAVDKSGHISAVTE